MSQVKHLSEANQESDPIGILASGRPGLVSISAEDTLLRALTLLGGNQAAHRKDDRRREPRLPTDEPALLQILRPLSDENSDVRIRDVSKNGLRILTLSKIMPGSFVKLRLKDYIAFGVTQYCVASEEGFVVGLHLHDCVRRSSIRGEVVSQFDPTTTESWLLGVDQYLAAGWAR